MPANIGFGCLGNGLTVWDRSRMHGGDYLTIAHIDGMTGAYRVYASVDAETLEAIKQQAAGVRAQAVEAWRHTTHYRQCDTICNILPVSEQIGRLNAIINMTSDERFAVLDDAMQRIRNYTISR